MQNFYTSSFKKYILTFIASFFAVMGLFVVLTFFMIKYLVEPKDNLMKHSSLFANSRITNAAFGDSRMSWGFTGSTDFVNLAYNGENIMDMEERARQYFENKKPGRVIIQADPHLFSQYRLSSRLKYYLDPSFYAGRYLGHHRKKLYGYWKTLIVKRAFKTTFHFHPSGWQELRGRWDLCRNCDVTAKNRVKLQTPVRNFRDHKVAEHYRNLVSMLSQKGADLCLVTLPVSYEYFSHASREPQFDKTIQFYRELSSQHNARYLNLIGVYSGEDHKKLFANQDHLNPEGAETFTEDVLAGCFENSKPETFSSYLKP